MGFYYELYPCIKSSIKDILGFRKPIKDQDIISYAILTIATVFILLILLILLTPWILFNYIMRGYLLLKLGSNYGGMLNMDTPFEVSRILINTVYIIEHDGRTQDFYNDIKSACKSLLASHSRFSSKIRKCLGFYYFLSNQITLDDIVVSVDYKDDNLTKEKLLSYLEKHYITIPSDEERLWEVKVFNKPIVWGDSTKTYYPVLIRTNHCIGDGICLSVFHQKHLMSKVVNTSFEHAVRSANKSTNFCGITNFHNNVAISKRLDYKQLDSGENGAKIAVFVEDEPKYFGIIKRLRAHLNVTFTDVFGTAALASITDYLKEKGFAPETVFYGNTARPVSENATTILSGDILANESTLHVTEVPCPASGSESITNHLKKLAKLHANTRSSCDSQLIYILQKIGGYLPPAFLTSILFKSTAGGSLGITNIPGPNFGMIQSHPIRDIIIFPSSFGQTRFMISMVTYGGRMQVALLTRNGLVATRDDLQRILNGTFKNIDLILEENRKAIENTHPTRR